MKNIHLIPTDKPSRLWFNDLIDSNELILSFREVESVNNQHIYITSDEEIKEGDYWIYICPINGLDYGDNNNPIVKNNLPPTWFEKLHDKKNYKKIILTTDQDLIVDGVQAIDDEFLEWFIKNPTCEFVKTDLVPVNEFGSEITVNSYGFDKFKYKIIIPQEEPKQETRVFGTEDDKSFWSDKPKQKCEHIKEYGCIKDICTCNTGPKQDPTLENAKLALREYILTNKEKVAEDLQEMREKSGTGRDETLEEAAKRTYQKGLQDDIDLSFYDGVRLGSKWQAEKMYSEVFEWLSSKDYLSDKMEFIQKEFEQFKKK